MNSHVDQSSLDSARKCDEVVARHDMKNEQNLSCVFQLDISFFLLVIFGENKYGSLMRLQDAGRRVNKPRPTMCCCVAFSSDVSENFCCLCMLRQESQNPTNGEMKMRDSKSYTSHDSQIYTLERVSTARVFLRFHKKNTLTTPESSPI